MYRDRNRQIHARRDLNSLSVEVKTETFVTHNVYANKKLGLQILYKMCFDSNTCGVIYTSEVDVEGDESG
jgi:hypothetical protein